MQHDAQATSLDPAAWAFLATEKAIDGADTLRVEPGSNRFFESHEGQV